MSGVTGAAAEIADRRAEWVRAVSEADLDAYLDVVTEDLVWLPPGQPAIEGRRAFGEWLRPFFDDFAYDFSLTASALLSAGGWAFERGTFLTVMTPRSGGEAMRHEGSYTVLWRREADGLWRIERYVDDSAADAARGVPSRG